MDRLIATNSVNLAGADGPPGVGTPQYGTDGNPTLNIPPTRWPAYQYNAIQEELVSVILAAGIALDKTNTSQLLAAIQKLGRIKLSANTTFFVRPDGNNANSGLINNAGGAWLTIQHAIDVLQTLYDLGGFVATIQLADGAYAGATVRGPFPGSTKGPASVILNGNAVTPANTTLTSTLIANDYGSIAIQNIKTTGVITGIQSAQYSEITIGAGVILATTGGLPLYASGGTINLGANLAVSGNNTVLCQIIQSGGILNAVPGIVITFTGTPVYSSTLFALAELANLHFGAGVTFVGAVSGVQWAVTGSAVLNASGATIPGTAGTTGSGGQIL